MKAIIYIPVILMALGACRSTKKTTTTSSAVQTESTNQRSLHEWQSLASTGRYWYYGTDSNFYFHPDSGLSGTGGNLWVQESSRHQGLYRYAQDSTVLLQENQDYSYVNKENEKIDKSWIGYVVIVFLFAAIGYVFWRK